MYTCRLYLYKLPVIMRVVSYCEIKSFIHSNRNYACQFLRLVDTRELAPETDSCNRFAPGACSIISNQLDMREQNSGAKVLLCNIFFC